MVEILSVNYDRFEEVITIQGRVSNQTTPYGWTVYPKTSVNHDAGRYSIYLYKFGSECAECGMSYPEYDYITLQFPMVGNNYDVYVNGYYFFTAIPVSKQ